jgi:uncharacterized protein
MKIAFVVHTPGQAYLWSHVVKVLKERGNDVSVIARGGKIIEQILSKRGIDYIVYGKSSPTISGKLLRLPSQFITCLRLIHHFDPEIVLGGGIVEANASGVLGKPCVIFEDTEITSKLEMFQYKITARAIVTPSCFKKDLGRKQIRVRSFKELAYLHPNEYKPDPDIFAELGIKPGEKYIILRFNSLGAVHDLKVRGLTDEQKHVLVHELEKHAKVFISAEGDLSPDLEYCRIPIEPYRIHHALNYAHMVFGDTGTMIMEAAVLGTPGIICASDIGLYGNFDEMENIYHLIYNLKFDEALSKAIELVQTPKEESASGRTKLLEDKLDMTAYLVEYIETFSRHSK